ncbi:acyl carrier protein [Pontibacter sp. E15-1]|uniref:acyl carrier protein n=1 Tax=Pontibacter sp. E15-1 TaxID=2919918 RepID=UPI001F4F6E5A|nr:acyl carrier protein [Pontibacter sp. E15-1]MCJ8163469.1 acyl carrier protein [Pontibacter sp. E15-1]
MHTQNYTQQAIEKEVVKVISSVTRVSPDRLLQVRDLTSLGLSILDVVDVILKLEKIYHLNIPDEVPVYSVDDFVGYIQSQQQPALSEACV